MRWGRPRRISTQVRVRVSSGRSQHRHLDLGRRWFIQLCGDIAVDPTDLSAMYGAVLTGGGVSFFKNQQDDWGADACWVSVSEVQRTFGAWIFARRTSVCGRTNLRGGGIFTVDKGTRCSGSGSLSLTYAPYDMATQPFEVDEPTTVPEPTTLMLISPGAWPGLFCGSASRRKLRVYPVFLGPAEGFWTGPTVGWPRAKKS